MRCSSRVFGWIPVNRFKQLRKPCLPISGRRAPALCRKVYRPQRWSAEQIQEEHQFAHDLLDDDVPVAAPIKFNNQTLLTHQGFYYAVFPSPGGRQFEADNIDQMEWVARYLGRIHQTGRKTVCCPSDDWCSGISY